MTAATKPVRDPCGEPLLKGDEIVYHGDNFCRSCAEGRIEKIKARNSRLLMALKRLSALYGKPRRADWLNDEAFENARIVDAQTQKAIADAEN